jgi:hypothetical protein
MVYCAGLSCAIAVSTSVVLCCALFGVFSCSPQELLDSSGLGHVTHLTRTEWSVLRGALGKPRRLSLNFLKQERQKLEAYRWGAGGGRGGRRGTDADQMRLSCLWDSI